MKYIKEILSFLTIFFLGGYVWGGTLISLSSTTYDRGYNDLGESVACDLSNNVVVTGQSSNGTDQDYLTIKYDSNLIAISSAAYDSGSSDAAHGVVCDSAGNIFVTGSRQSGSECFTIKYSPDLIVISSATFDTVNMDIPLDITADNSENIIIVGRTGPDYLVAKYDNSLNFISSATYNSGGVDIAIAATCDNMGNIIVTGQSQSGFEFDCFTIKYDNDLVVISSATLDTGYDDYVKGVDCDSQGNIVIAGYFDKGTNDDFFLTKYDPNFAILSSITYGIPGKNSYIRSVACDTLDNIVIVGVLEFAYYCTLKYNKYLILIASDTWRGGEDAEDVICDSLDNIIVTGSSRDGANWNYTTIKYLGSPKITSVTPTSGFIGQMPTITLNGYNFAEGCSLSFDDEGIIINSINFVERTTLESNISITDDCLPGIKGIIITNSDGCSSEDFSGFRVKRSLPDENLKNVYMYPNPFNSRQGHTVIKFINLTAQAKIKIYNIAGELVRTMENTFKDGREIWNTRNDNGNKIASGIYIYVVTDTEGHKKVGKLAIIR